jgi:hypothetical protein
MDGNQSGMLQCKIYQTVMEVEMGIVSSETLDNKVNTSDDAAFASALGFAPVGVADLEGTADLFGDLDPNAPPVYKAPSNVRTEKPEEKVDELEALARTFRKVDPDKVLTNFDAVAEKPVVTVNRVGSFPYVEDYEDGVPEGSVRLDNVCGRLPYAGLPEFAKGICVKDITIPVAAEIYNANRAGSNTALFDALGKTVNVPYRRLTVADHLQIMYYHLVNSYPLQPLTIRWETMYRGDKIPGVATKFKLTETVLSMSEKEWAGFRAKGFTLPRVYDIENDDIVDSVSGGKYVMDMVRWIDPYHSLVEPYVLQAAKAGSLSPRLQGRIDFLASKPIRYRVEIEEFMQACGPYGVTETLCLTLPNDKARLVDTVEYLNSVQDRTPAQEEEFIRLSDILGKKVDALNAERKRVEDMELPPDDPSKQSEDAQLEAMAEAIVNTMFVPKEEEVALIRDPASFFPFI